MAKNQKNQGFAAIRDVVSSSRFRESRVYDAEMRKSFGLGFHPNPMGYYAYALIVGNYIDYIIRSNPQEFATIPFVGTLLKNKDYK